LKKITSREVFMFVFNLCSKALANGQIDEAKMDKLPKNKNKNRFETGARPPVDFKDQAE
jgi:hypothetical protein